MTEETKREPEPVLVSDCCGCPMGEYYEDALICPECSEHCGVHMEGEDE